MFSVNTTRLSGVLKLERTRLEDERGHLERLYCEKSFEKLISNKKIMQINKTLTKKRGTIRGLHFQYPPCAETKIILCVSGAIYDVAVDIRSNSKTLFEHYGTTLSGENLSALVIPEGFAHGFQTLTDDCTLIYFHTQEYKVAHEGFLNALNADLKIKWPLEVKMMSERDKGPGVQLNAFKGV